MSNSQSILNIFNSAEILFNITKRKLLCFLNKLNNFLNLKQKYQFKSFGLLNGNNFEIALIFSWFGESINKDGKRLIERSAICVISYKYICYDFIKNIIHLLLII